MLQILKRSVVSLVAGLLVLISGLALAPAVYAAPSDAAKQACEGVSVVAGGSCSNESTGPDVNTIINTVINLLSWIIGVIAVIMIIYGGFKFVTSAGDSGKVTSARSTIIYALIGLVVVAFAQTIVKFVLGQFIK
jgi:hypothetical protein